VARGSVIIAQVPIAKFRGPFVWIAAGLALACMVVVWVDAFPMGSLTNVIWRVLIATWNCVPLLVAFGLAFVTRASRSALRFSGYGFALGAATLSTFEHVAWAFDIGKVATGSSTSGLLFLFLPPYACFFGCILAAPAAVIGYLIERHRARAS
jgi:hypothetical protein